jgi:predicted small integral membrane protein
MGLSWMAWTWPTAAFFVFILLALTGMAIWEWRSPGGAPRRGILGLDTTRGDRLFTVHLAARQRLHLPRLARHHGHAAVGRAHHLAGLRGAGVPAGLGRIKFDRRRHRATSPFETGLRPSSA